MTRSFQNLEPHCSEFKRFAVFHGYEGILGLTSGPEPDLCAAAVAQLEMSGKKIRMEVSQKNVADLHSQPFGIGQILQDVPLRVDHGRTLAGFVRDQV